MESTGSQNHDEVFATIATVVVVGIGCAAFEAALLPGVALGVAAVWLPRYYKNAGSGIKAANIAVNVIDLASRAARLGLRVSRGG